jgi:DDE_Tnp_1-associated
MDMLSDVDDPRQPSNGIRHDFQELLVMTLSAVLSDCDTIEDVAAGSHAHTGWPCQFLVPAARHWAPKGTGGRFRQLPAGPATPRSGAPVSLDRISTSLSGALRCSVIHGDGSRRSL